MDGITPARQMTIPSDWLTFIRMLLFLVYQVAANAQNSTKCENSKRA
jgi:hypothetical protein